MDAPAEPERLGAVPADRLTDDQRRTLDLFRTRRGTDPFGPFVPMLWSPDAMARAAAMGDYLRFGSAFPPRLSEFVILIVARALSQQYEWSLHYPIALDAGVDPDVATAIAQGQRPDTMAHDEAALYDFCTELVRHHTVSDETYAAVLTRFGENGVIDAISLVGYYTLLALVLNVARTPPEPGVEALPPLPA